MTSSRMPRAFLGTPMASFEVDYVSTSELFTTKEIMEQCGWKTNKPLKSLRRRGLIPLARYMRSRNGKGMSGYYENWVLTVAKSWASMRRGTPVIGGRK